MKPEKPTGPFFAKGEKIVLKKDGTWIADGTEITHEQTRDLFYRAIHFDKAEKKYYLEVGFERIFIEVEDTCFFVTALEKSANKLSAKLSNTASESISPKNLSYQNETLYLSLANGERARFLSAPYYDLLQELKEDKEYYYLKLGKERANLEKKSVKKK